MAAQGELTAAQTHMEAVYEAHQRLLGPEHPDTLTSRGNLASVGNRAARRRLGKRKR